MRLFISLPIPEAARGRLVAVQRRVDALDLPLRATRAEGLHVTIAFLGETPEERVADVRRAMDAAVHSVSAFRLELAGLGAFPNERRPRVLWAGLSGDLGALSALYARMRDRLGAAGLPTEERAFRPHVTLARARAEWRPAQLEALRSLLAGPPPASEGWRVSEVHLMRSELRREGARYTALYTSALEG